MATADNLLRLMRTALDPTIPESILETREKFLEKVERITAENDVTDAPYFHHLLFYRNVKYVRDCFGNVWRWKDYWKF